MLLDGFTLKSPNGSVWEGRIARTSYHEGVIPTIRARQCFYRAQNREGGRAGGGSMRGIAGEGVV